MLDKSYKTAIGGISMALIVVMMIPSVIDSFVYLIPTLSSMIILFCVIELDKKWAFGVYAGSALILLLALPNKESAVIYTAFFGWYPIFKAYIAKVKIPKTLKTIIKFAIFNISFVVSYWILVRILGIPFKQIMGIEDENSLLGRYGIPLFLALGNVAFAMLDRVYYRFAILYQRKYQSIFRKTFKIKK